MNAMAAGTSPAGQGTEKLRKRVCGNLLAAEYRFAKTMPENPHWYTLRKDWSDDAAFVEAVEFIRANGYIEIYKKSKYTMFNLNGYKYWTMGAPIWYRNGNPCTILINRAKISEDSDYDLIADRYDRLHIDPESQIENDEITTWLYAKSDERTLDIGCGTGLLLDYCRIDDYVGLDPSAQMLGQLVARRPNRRGNICNARFEEFYDGDGFDLIVSLFGSMNYVDPAYFNRIYGLLKPGGRIFAMFYQERYVPVTYERAGVAFPHHLTSEYDLSKFTITPFKDTFLIAEYTLPE